MTAAADSQRGTLSRLASFIWHGLDRPRLWRGGAAIGLLVGAKLATLTVPWLLGQLVGAAAERTGDLFAVMGGLVLAYACMRLVETACTELKNSLFIHVVQGGIRDLARKVFAHLHALPLSFHLSRQTGGLAIQIERGTKGIEFIVSTMAFNFFPTVLELLAVCVIFWALYGPGFALVTVVTIIVYSVFTGVVSQWRIRFRRALNDANERANTRAVDSLLNHETVKLFSAEAREVDGYDARLATHERAAMVTQWTLSLLNLGQAVIITAGLAGLLLLAARDAAAGHLGAGDLATLNAYLLQIFLPLGFLGTAYRIVSQSLTDIERVFGLLDEPSSTPDRSGARPLAAGPGELELRDVAISLGGRQIFTGLSLHVPARASVGLVGESGTGKTTVTRLLGRLLDPDAGSVRIDGQDLRDVTQLSVRAALAYVPQDAVMFNTTLRHNVAFGRPDTDDAEITAALATAGLGDFVARLPAGLDTEVGERGLKLSGGERQRLAIARALLKRPRAFILDEATSSLDAPTEARIKEAMAAATAGRTTLVIAHRLATVTNCDFIAVLDGGKVVERGTHTELLAAGGHYARAWEIQSRQRPEPEIAASAPRPTAA